MQTSTIGRWMGIPSACALLLLLTSPTLSGFEVKSPVVSLRAYPERIELSSMRDFQSIVVLIEREDGSTEDVTANSSVTCDPPIATYVNDTLLPKKDGAGEVQIRFEENTTTIPLIVKRSTWSPVPEFRKDVLPVLTKAGCNSGKCHGSAAGKDGFRLSLFGYDPSGDHARLTRDLLGRRIHLGDPERSLLLQKGLGRVSHTGGGRMEESSEAYSTLMDWMSAGAPADENNSAIPTSIAVYPREAIFENPGGLQKMVVVAHFSDGTDRDVSAQSVFLSNNEGCVEVTEEGMTRAIAPGNVFVLARYDQFTEGVSLVVRPGTPFQFPDLHANNYIDTLVYKRLEDLHMIPSGVIEDEPFIRRVFIDLIGLLPTSSEQAQFLSNRDSNKRESLVASLVNRREFRDLWIMHWSELLQIRSNNGLSTKGLKLYDQWLREQVHSGKKIDEIVRTVISASGGTFENPPANYYQTETSPQLIAESIAQSFLGTRIQCAQCHNHPFDRWTMDDYYGFASFFSQVGYKPGKDPRELTILNLGEGNLKHPIAGRPVIPKFLGGDSPTLTNDQDYRFAVAEWIGSKQNRAFAKNIANIVWAHFMGVGIVDPIDDFRVSNPPSNPQLLEALADHLIDYDFDISRLAQDICLSRTYQLDVASNSSNHLDNRHFSHGRSRRMRAEVLLDCICQITGVHDKLPGLGPAGRAVELADGPTPNYFLTTFGRSTRQSPCSCEVKTNPTLSQAMHLLNGETTNNKIKQGQVIEKLLSDSSVGEAVDELFRRCYCRLPTVKERDSILQKLKEEYHSPKEGIEDLFWALLNSNEFLFNH